MRYWEGWVNFWVASESIDFDCFVLTCDRHLMFECAGISFYYELGYHGRLLLFVVSNKNDFGPCKDCKFLLSKDFSFDLRLNELKDCNEQCQQLILQDLEEELLANYFLSACLKCLLLYKSWGIYLCSQ